MIKDNIKNISERANKHFIKFINRCYNLSLENSHSLFDPNSDLSKEFTVDSVTWLFWNKDTQLLELIKMLAEENIDDDMLYPLLNKFRNESIESGNIIIRDSGTDPSRFHKHKEIYKPYEKWLLEYNSEVVPEQLRSSRSDIIRAYIFIYFTYIYYEKDQLLYPSLEQPNTNAIYGKTLLHDGNYNAWGLIPIDEDRVLECESFNLPRIYDKNHNKTLFTIVGKNLIEVLAELKKKELIEKLSIRVNDNYIYEGYNNEDYICEAKEFGTFYEMNVNKLPEISKLYSDDNYNKSLWITHCGNDLTFEELSEDKQIGLGKFGCVKQVVATRMLHLQYDYNDKEPIIKHLDHEYIFYTLDEYKARKTDRRVKGKAFKRVKTFKIDGSAISFDYKCNSWKRVSSNPRVDPIRIKVPFIYFVLNGLFVNKDLIDEYFQKIL